MHAFNVSIRTRGVRWLVLGLVAMLAATASAQGLNYLIVTAPNYAGSAPLNQFVAAKQAQGYNVSVYTVPSGTSNTAIRNYIKSLWGTAAAPKFVLLVGDTSGPTSTSSTLPHFTGGGSKQAPTDLPYGCMDDGDDWHPEIPVGRFSVTSVAMLANVVEKSLFVEAGVFPDPDYVKRGVFIAGTSTNGMAEPTHDWVIETYFDPIGYEGIRIYATQGGTTQQVTNAVNNGSLWLGYYGHSGSGGWWAPPFNQGHVQALNNYGLYGVVWSFSCNVGDFTIGECFGETWQRVPDKGAAAVIFPSGYIYWGSPAEWLPSTILEKSFFRAFFEDGIWQVGPAWHAALYYFLNDYTGSMDRKRNFFELYNLLGDPSLTLPRPYYGPDPIVTVRVPNGGETWTVGETYNIEWLAYDDVGVTSVDIYLSTDSGATFPYTVAADLEHTGEYAWQVPHFYSHNCRIKVVAHDGDGNSGEDMSDGDFTITPLGPRVIYDFPMDSNPGWSTQGLWAFGQPTGGGGQYGCPDPTSGYTGINVYGYNLYGDYENNLPERHLTSTPLDCTGVTDVTLTFWRWLGVEQPLYDKASIRISNDGTSWTTIWQNPTEITDCDWVYQEFDISALADNQPTVYLRWTMGPTDSMWQYCGWNIDDVQIIGVPAPVVGDLNCDGAVDGFDIQPFILALTNPGQYAIEYPYCDVMLADVNGDGVVDGFDVQPFVDLLTGGG